MPRRRRSMAPSRSSRSVVSVVRRCFLFGRFFFGAQIDAAELLALLLELLDALLGLFERRQFLAVLDLGALGKFFRRAFEFVADAVAQFVDARGRGFEQRLRRGRALRARRRARRRRPSRSCRLRRDAFRLRRARRRPRRGRLRRRRSRRAARCACRRSLSGTASALSSSPRSVRRGGVRALRSARRRRRGALASARVRRRWRRGGAARISPSRLRPSSAARASLLAVRASAAAGAHR